MGFPAYPGLSLEKVWVGAESWSFLAYPYTGISEDPLYPDSPPNK